ncbi:hypothetical protein QTO34_019878, partial [Cnephaeus nilssonii]
MKRDRAISSNSISKAISGVSAVDDSDLIEMLLTAIPVIKHCLHGIEAKCYSMAFQKKLFKKKKHLSQERSPRWSLSQESSRMRWDLLHNEVQQ